MNKTDDAMRIDLSWSGDLLFKARADGVALSLDGDSENGFSPMQALLASLCACMGIDVVMILQKMRADLKRLNISVVGTRNDSPPKYFRKIAFDFDIKGAIPKDRVERAIQLSFEKYCSVFHSLRKDIEISYDVTLSIEEE